LFDLSLYFRLNLHVIFGQKVCKLCHRYEDLSEVGDLEVFMRIFVLKVNALLL